MKKEEKQIIYELLKTASQNINGFTTKKFSNELTFFDDEQKPTPLQNTSSPNIGADSKLLNIQEKINSCTRCTLLNQPSKSLGTGVYAPLVLVLANGRPFNEVESILLEKELISIQLTTQKNCYIANIVKCSAQNNRFPQEAEVQSCISFLDAQITALKPKFILAFGSECANYLFKIKDSVSTLRKNNFEYKNVPLMITHHPKEVLKNSSLKREVWEDLKSLRQKLINLVGDYTLQ